MINFQKDVEFSTYVLWFTLRKNTYIWIMWNYFSRNKNYTNKRQKTAIAWYGKICICVAKGKYIIVVCGT